MSFGILFISHPESVLLVAAILCILFLAVSLFQHFQSWPLFSAALAWTLYAFWEFDAKTHKYNIRPDLILIIPVLLGLTVWGLAHAFGPRRDKNNRE